MKYGLLCCVLLTLATDAVAHRLDEYLQATRISVATNRIDLSIDLSPGVAIAGQLLVMIDKDGDGQVSEEEENAYTQRVLEDIQLTLDESVLAFELAKASFPELHEVRDGLGIIQIKATAPVGDLVTGNHVLRLTNAHLPEISVYQVNALRPKDDTIAITTQTRDELQMDYHLEFEVRLSQK